MKKKQLSLALIKNIGDVSLDALPEILMIVPIYGPILSKVLEKVLKMYGEKKEANIQKEMDSLNNRIKEETIKEEEVNDLVIKIAEDYIKENTQHTSIYMFGIMIYTLDDSRMDEEDAENIDYLFSEKGTIEETDDEENVIEIKSFLYEYTKREYLSKNDDYYLTPKSLIINFDDTIKYRRNEQEIINFIANLNDLLNGEVFWEYTIF